MNYTNSYTINSSLFQEFFGLLGNMTHSNLTRQIEYLKVENEILHSKGQNNILAVAFAPWPFKSFSA